MAEARLYVIAKNPQEQHVAQNVREPGVEKHAGGERKQSAFEGTMSSQCGRDAGRNHGIGQDKGLFQSRRQRKLVNEDGQIGEYQQDIDGGELA